MSQQRPCLPVSSRYHRKRKNDEDDNAEAAAAAAVECNDFENVEEMDADTYLRRVVEQASRLPDIMVAPVSASLSACFVNPTNQQPSGTNLFTTGSAASAQYLTSNRTAIHPPPTQFHAPTKEWVDQTLLNFSALRNYLESCKVQGVGSVRAVPLPPMKDRYAWREFCLGRNAANGNPGGYYHDESDEERGSEPNGTAEPWREELPEKGYLPTVSLLLQMDQVMIRRVFGHLAEYDCGTTAVVGAAWMYALLARLEKPIHRDDAVRIYSALKRYTELRRAQPASVEGTHCTATKTNIATLNVLIAVIGIYFEQGGGYANLMVEAPLG
jgi:gem associated protein 2